MDPSTPYRTAARATGVWMHQLFSTDPAVAIAEVAAEIAAVSVSTGVPLTAYARTTGGYASSVLLARDPSVTHGVPDVGDCERAAAYLAATGNWDSGRDYTRSSILVAIGLREGYDPDARVHTLAEFRQRMLHDCGTWTGWSAELISARPQPDGTAQTYREPGVLTLAEFDQLTALAAIADDFAQDRIVTHDWVARSTTAYRHL